jgi:hypothetical protein
MIDSPILRVERTLGRRCNEVDKVTAVSADVMDLDIGGLLLEGDDKGLAPALVEFDRSS